MIYILKRIKKKLLASMIVVLLFISLDQEIFAAGIQKPSESATVQGYLDVMQVYNPDVYFFVNVGLNHMPDSTGRMWEELFRK